MDTCKLSAKNCSIITDCLAIYLAGGIGITILHVVIAKALKRMC